MLSYSILADNASTLPLAIATIVAAGLAAGPAFYAAMQSRHLKRDIKTTDDDPSIGALISENRHLMRKLIKFERYTHRRNHQILGAIFKVYLAIYLLGKKIGVELPEQDEPDYSLSTDDDDLYSDDDPLT